MRYFFDNEYDDSDYTPDALTEDVNYPLSHLRDYQLTKHYRSESASAQYIVLDGAASGAITATMAWMAYHNLTASMSATIKGNDTDSWGSPIASANFTFASGIMYVTFDSASVRYWRWDIDDTTISADYIKLGRIGVGTYFDMTHAARAGAVRRIVDTSENVRNPTGQIYGLEGITYVEYDMDFSYLDDDERVNLETMWETCKKIKPIVFIPNPSDTTLPALYTVISNFELTHIFAWKWHARMTLSEAL